jgi:hypothetical protein
MYEDVLVEFIAVWLTVINVPTYIWKYLARNGMRERFGGKIPKLYWLPEPIGITATDFVRETLKYGWAGDKWAKRDSAYYHEYLNAKYPELSSKED